MQIHKTRRRRNSPATKIIATVLCIACFFVPHVFAQTSTTSTTLQSFQDGLHSILSIMSRGWIILASLAGKLMTNDRVFGSFLHMDVYLWKLWNIMKNFANFTLVGIVLWSIIKGLVSKEGIKPLPIIKNALIAGILIQASRFMMGALVDLSTVAVTAVGSFPSTFIQANSEWKNQIVTEVNTKMKGVKYLVDFSSNQVRQPLSNTTNITNTTASDNDALASIMPTANSISGPLIFLGMSAFRFQDYLNVSNPTLGTLTINFSLKALILIFYTIGLLLLFIANLIRVVFLWIFIIAVPFIILIKVFKSDKIETDSKFAKYLSFSGLINMIFKPVVFIGVLSLILIFIVSLQNIMGGDNVSELNGVKISMQTGSSVLSVQDVSSVTINDNMFQDVGNTSKNMFADMIIFLLGMFLTWELVKLSVQGSGPIEGVLKGVTDFTQGLAKNLPIMGGFGFNALKGMSQKTTTKVAKGLGFNENWKTGKLGADAEFKNKLSQYMGMGGSRTDTDMTELDKAGDDAFWTTTYAKADDMSEGLSLDVYGGQWKKRLKKWFNKKTPAELTNLGFIGTYSIDGFDAFFKGSGDDDQKAKQNRGALHKLMMNGNIINSRNKTVWDWKKDRTAPTYDELLANTYFGKKT